MVPLGFALAAVAGLLLGLLGGGGSILTVPILVYVFGLEAKRAIAVSLGVVGVVSLFGAIGHWRAGRVNGRVALLFGGVAMAGAYGGARLAAFMTGSAQLSAFAAAMLVAAAFMLRPMPSGIEPTTAARQAPPLTAAASAALAVGVFTGMVGIGGGFLVVPALVVFVGLPMKEAIGTSLAVIAMNATAGLAGYAGHVDPPWTVMAGFTTAASLGMVAGTSLVGLVPAAALRRAFAVFLVLVGTSILFQNRHVLVPTAPAAAPERAPAVTGASR
jgi:uncharacterized protein